MLNRYPKGDPNLVEYLHMITPSIYSESKMLLEKVEDPLVISTCVKALLTGRRWIVTCHRCDDFERTNLRGKRC